MQKHRSRENRTLVLQWLQCPHLIMIIMLFNPSLINNQNFWTVWKKKDELRWEVTPVQEWEGVQRRLYTSIPYLHVHLHRSLYQPKNKIKLQVNMVIKCMLFHVHLHVLHKSTVSLVQLFWHKRARTHTGVPQTLDWSCIPFENNLQKTV